MDEIKLNRIYEKVNENIYEYKNFNQNDEITREKIENIVEMTLNMFSFDISYKEDIVKRVLSQYEIFQEEGVSIRDDYGEENWYDINKQEGLFWSKYKKYLSKKLPFKVIENLDKNVLNEIVSLLGNPNSNKLFTKKGLVIGDVQSGKTSTYIGLIAKAIDAGYRFIIVLTGVTENLRSQTQKRIDEGLIGYDSTKNELVGVGDKEGKAKIRTFTTVTKDIEKSDINRDSIINNIDSQTPSIIVTKKNKSSLKNISKAFEVFQNKSNTNYPLLLIDDEADNASINTRKNAEDPTLINKEIRKILRTFDKSSYVGFTATPFANVLINPNASNDEVGTDLFPENFIYWLNSPSNYIGAKKIFLENEENSLNIIDDYDEEIFPLKHDKNWEGDHLFPSFEDSIVAFLLANAIRDLRGEKNTHRSMLINVSRFVCIQNIVKDITEKIFNKYLQAIDLFHKLDLSDMLENKVMKRVKYVWDKEYGGKLSEPAEFLDVVRNLYESIQDIEIKVVNSKNGEKIDYENKSSVRVIAIGGLVLSRGLTLEGLMISYFYRNTSTYDVLMQMGRWFGYRDTYKDVCRIWISNQTKEWYTEIANAVLELEKDIKNMNEQGKRPRDFGIRIRNDSESLGITAPNKSYNAKKQEMAKLSEGWVYEAATLYENEEINANNLKQVKILYNSLKERDQKVSKKYYRNIEPKNIFNLFSKIKMKKLTNFDLDVILEDIKKSLIKNQKYDVLFMDGDSEKKVKMENGDEIGAIKRSYEVNIADQEILISGCRRRLGAPTDTKYGLDKESLNIINSTPTISKNNKVYMVKGRNPLIIIYFIELSNRQNKENLSSLEKMIEYKYNESNDDSLLVSFAYAIPAKKTLEEISEATYYYNSQINPFSIIEDEESTEE